MGRPVFPEETRAWLRSVWRVSDIWIALAALPLFWLLRAGEFSGDGELIATITHGGKWLVNNELLSQIILQAVWQIGSRLGADILTVLNVVSCISGGISLFVLLGCFRAAGCTSPSWAVLLFASSGFLIYACGRTEYYPIVLPVLWLYCLAGLGFIQRQISFSWVCGVFWLVCAMHFGMLFLLPSLLGLAVWNGRRDALRPLFTLALGILFLFFLRNGLGMFGYKVAGLSGGINLLPLFPYEGMDRYYTFFEWGHLYDWLYGWTMRSWILWPMIVVSVWLCGWRSLLRPDRLFLLAATLGFTGFAIVWHPDLGIRKDWDLFALEAAPCMILAATYLSVWSGSVARRWLLGAACGVSIVLMATHVVLTHNAGPHEHGRIVLMDEITDETTWIVRGDNHAFPEVSQRVGVYPIRWIDRPRAFAWHGHVVVLPDQTTGVRFSQPNNP